MQQLADCRGVAVTASDRKAIEGLERAHDMALGFYGDAIAEIDRTLEAYPDFIMGHLFKAAWLTQAMETRIYPIMVGALERAEARWDHANDRERGHMKAVRAWVDGDFYQAVQHWEAVLVEEPRDLLALQLAHLSDVLLGDVINQRDTVARVMPAWTESMPGYGYVLGFYSFGLEEMRDFSEAEEAGRRALALNPKDAYAIHAVAHVMEMQGRQQGGIWLMNSRKEDWANGNFKNHLWWHKALFHLDLRQDDEVLQIYDGGLRGESDPGAEKYEELDAAALLWRCKLLGIDVGNRWHDLAKCWASSAEDTLYAFNDVHAMMAFVADGRNDLAAKMLNANARYTKHANDANVAMSREIGLPFCHALQAFAEERYADAVDHLLPVRYRTHRLGGSHAQRDVILWTLLEAALRGDRYKLALALANERCALKPTSPVNWTFRARALEALGDATEAKRARAQAEVCLAA
ncbi:MAG: tetratricopeptide repeat protein [Alphaproteobacteria bacterium]|nr:tetratricopeptide repeat protein [Alphaproteobacteria bacterium]